MSERLRILWIEDDPDDLKLGSRIARRSMDIDAVDTIAAAEERLICNAYDAVVLDNHVLNGEYPETFNRIYPLIGPAALLVLTGHVDKAMSDDLMSRGADLVMYKGDINETGLAQLIDALAVKVRHEHQRRTFARQLLCRVRECKKLVAMGR